MATPLGVGDCTSSHRPDRASLSEQPIIGAVTRARSELARSARPLARARSPSPAGGSSPATSSVAAFVAPQGACCLRAHREQQPSRSREEIGGPCGTRDERSDTSTSFSFSVDHRCCRSKGVAHPPPTRQRERAGQRPQSAFRRLALPFPGRQCDLAGRAPRARLLVAECRLPEDLGQRESRLLVRRRRRSQGLRHRRRLRVWPRARAAPATDGGLASFTTS